MQDGFFSKIATFIATIILFKLRGKKSSVRFGGRAHPLLTVGFLADVVMYIAVAVALLFVLVTIGFALFADDPHLPILLASAGAFCAALIQPKRPWRWWLIAAFAIPLAFALGEQIGISSSVAHWKPQQAILAAMSPFLAAYVAAALRGIARRIGGTATWNRSATAR